MCEAWEDWFPVMTLVCARLFVCLVQSVGRLVGPVETSGCNFGFRPWYLYLDQLPMFPSLGSQKKPNLLNIIIRWFICQFHHRISKMTSPPELSMNNIFLVWTSTMSWVELGDLCSWVFSTQTPQTRNGLSASFVFNRVHLRWSVQEILTVKTGTDALWCRINSSRSCPSIIASTVGILLMDVMAWYLESDAVISVIELGNRRMSHLATGLVESESYGLYHGTMFWDCQLVSARKYLSWRSTLSLGVYFLFICVLICFYSLSHLVCLFCLIMFVCVWETQAWLWHVTNCINTLMACILN